MKTALANRGLDWRAAKGPHEGNTSGFTATGHRLLVVCNQVETTTSSGIVLPSKAVEAEKNLSVWARVVEIGHDAWSDKKADFAEVGDVVLIGQYTGKFHISPVDHKEYRFINDLDVISVLTKPEALGIAL